MLIIVLLLHMLVVGLVAQIQSSEKKGTFPPVTTTLAVVPLFQELLWVLQLIRAVVDRLECGDSYARHRGRRVEVSRRVFIFPVGFWSQRAENMS